MLRGDLKGKGLQEEGTCIYVCLSHFIVETKVKKRRNTKGKFKRFGKDQKNKSLLPCCWECTWIQFLYKT